MRDVPHLPILRKGRPYRSVDRTVVSHFRTREPIVEVSQANVGLIRRDLLRQGEIRRTLADIPVAQLVAISKAAAEHFQNATLPIDPAGLAGQTPHDYVEQVSATTGMPWANVRRNMPKVHGVLSHVDEVLQGLTRGLDLSVLDDGVGQRDGRMISFFPRGDSLGVVLPSNSPGVHSLWAPTTVLKMPLVLKPGSAEPWTPFRMIQAWLKAGCPPTPSASTRPITPAATRSCGHRPRHGLRRRHVDRTLEGGPRVEVHGPGYSKVVIGADALTTGSRTST